MSRKKKPMLAIYLVRNEPTGEVINAWLKSFDPNALGGQGEVTWTDDRDEAMQFEGVEEVHAYWTQESSVLPLRPDGQPNRPLTAFTIEVRPVEKENGVRWGQNLRRGRDA